jgi:hypothetical protein
LGNSIGIVNFPRELLHSLPVLSPIQQNKKFWEKDKILSIGIKGFYSGSIIELKTSETQTRRSKTSRSIQFTF